MTKPANQTLADIIAALPDEIKDQARKILVRANRKLKEENCNG
jgi:hypothetical protein